MLDFYMFTNKFMNMIYQNGELTASNVEDKLTKLIYGLVLYKYKSNFNPMSMGEIIISKEDLVKSKAVSKSNYKSRLIDKQDSIMENVRKYLSNVGICVTEYLIDSKGCTIEYYTILTFEESTDYSKGVVYITSEILCSLTTAIDLNTFIALFMYSKKGMTRVSLLKQLQTFTGKFKDIHNLNSYFFGDKDRKGLVNKLKDMGIELEIIKEGYNWDWENIVVKFNDFLPKTKKYDEVMEEEIEYTYEQMLKRRKLVEEYNEFRDNRISLYPNVGITTFEEYKVLRKVAGSFLGENYKNGILKELDTKYLELGYSSGGGDVLDTNHFTNPNCSWIINNLLQNKKRKKGSSIGQVSTELYEEINKNARPVTEEELKALEI